ncbi:MAG TPA: hypothetical protein VIH89_06525 [Candidatus Sulfotelmatobacter sp.]
MARKHNELAPPDAPPPVLEREPDFTSKYANNVRFHSTVHDLTLIFGQSDVTSGSEVVRQHTAITIPWSVLKLALYYAAVNVAVHEVYNGIIPVPPQQKPPRFPEPTAEMLAENPKSQQAADAANKIWEDFTSPLEG